MFIYIHFCPDTVRIEAEKPLEKPETLYKMTADKLWSQRHSILKYLQTYTQMCWKDSCLGVLVMSQTEGVESLPQVSKSLFTGQTESLLNEAQVSALVWLFEYKNLACCRSENLWPERI